jgi:hypothetical protein
MRHVILTCKNHPELRWSCKEIAYTPGYGYNENRSIFYWGIGLKNPDGTPKMFEDGSGLDCTRFDPVSGDFIEECNCSPTDMILAPEDRLVFIN